MTEKQSRSKLSGPSVKTGKQAPFFKALIQPKLTINQPNENFEQEADMMADQVMRKSTSHQQLFSPSPFSISGIQRKCAHCEEEENNLQKKGEHGAPTQTTAPPVVHDVIHSTGQPMEPATRQFMESGFGYDFGKVQIHNDSLAHKSSSEIHALAYTHGNHVAFGAGQYHPNTHSGRQLLAHELTHVIQQSGNNQSVVQRRNDAFGKECPDTVEIGDKKPIPSFNKDMYAAGFRTYFGLVTDMKVGPKNSYESCITEVLKVEENTCGETGNMAGYNSCTPKDHCMKINDACPGGSCGDAITHTGFAASPTAFIDLHRTDRPTSLLTGTGKTECKVKCLQRYGCGGKEIGRFYITRNFKLGEYLDGTTKVPITTGSIEKEPAKK